MSISENIVDVGLKLLRETGPMDRNTFLSPVSITCCLAMAYAGANGSTKAQMNEVLFSGMNDETVHTEFSQFMAELNKNIQMGLEQGYMLLTSVNRIYAQKEAGFKLMDKFKSILRDKYKAELHFANFISEAKAARLEINSYVSEQTNNKIKNLIGQGVLNALTRLVLINAVYFKAEWETQFNKDMSKDMPFYITEQLEKKIPMMIALDELFHYAENDDVQVLGMPYMGNDLMFIVILPKNKNNLEAVESNMDGKVMVQLIKSMTEELVNVYLPKFKLEEKFELNEALEQMGVVDMFNPADADFSGINGAKDLYVSHVIHKAFIEVNETGTEAAAATAVVMAVLKCGKLCRGSAPLPKEFQADHPFLFAIIHTESSNALFIGRYADATDERCRPSPAETDSESSLDASDTKASSPDPTNKNVSSPDSTDRKVYSSDAAKQKGSCHPAGNAEMPCQASGPVADAGDKKTVAKKSYCCCC